MSEPLRTELHEDYAAALAESEANGIPTSSQVSPEGARELLANAWETAGVLDNPPAVGAVRGYPIAGPNGSVPIRIYTPDGDGPFPVILWMHGGGWIRGDIDTADTTCRMITRRTDSTVVSVDYRLAPEHPFPAGLRDCYAVLEWIDANPGVVHADGEHLVVGGTSAGGNFAAALCLMARDFDGPSITFHVPDMPVMEYNFDRQSYRENATGYGLETADMRNYWNHYVAEELDAYHPYASPLRARDLSDLPPAYVTTAGFDVLRDEGIAYVERLQAAGIPVTHRHYPHAPHAAIASVRLVQELEPSLAALEDLTTALNGAFH